MLYGILSNGYKLSFKCSFKGAKNFFLGRKNLKFLELRILFENNRYFSELKTK